MIVYLALELKFRNLCHIIYNRVPIVSHLISARAPAMCCHGCARIARMPGHAAPMTNYCPCTSGVRYTVFDIRTLVTLSTPYQSSSLISKLSVLLYCSASGSRKIIVNLSTVILAPPLLSTYTLLVIFFLNFPLILSALPVIHYTTNHLLS